MIAPGVARVSATHIRQGPPVGASYSPCCRYQLAGIFGV